MLELHCIFQALSSSLEVAPEVSVPSATVLFSLSREFKGLA